MLATFYINRNIIGAGGRRASPGGEALRYRAQFTGACFTPRFFGEQTIVTVNTVAAGGNVTLMTS